MSNILVAVIGFATVFVVLVVLIAIITIMSSIINPRKKQKDEPAPVKVEKPKVVKPQDDEDEIIAAITAAIACMAQSEGKKFKIRSFRRV